MSDDMLRKKPSLVCCGREATLTVTHDGETDDVNVKIKSADSSPIHKIVG